MNASPARGAPILMMAGGTGGHVYPALAVARELLARGYPVDWVGTQRGLEFRVVPAAGIRLHLLPVRGVRGKSLLHKCQALMYLVWSVLRALWLVARLRPRCVVGMGGYASGPGGVAAWLLRIPVLVHEQNAVAGTTNRLLAPLAKQILAGFPASFSDKANVNAIVTGNPVRRELIDAATAQPYDYIGQRPLHLLVLGGSLGAQPVNEVVPATLRALYQSYPGQVHVRHQTGEAHIDRVRASYGSLLAEGVQIFPYIEDMAEAYAWSDLVLCRAGALTVAELAIMGRPSILVPLPHAIDDHQTANARYLSDCGGAQLLHQKHMRTGVLVEALAGYLRVPALLSTMATKALSRAYPQATESVADRCEELLRV